MAKRTKVRRRFEVEGLESRQLLALTYQFAPYADASAPTWAVATGPDGNTWFGVSQGATNLAGIGKLDAKTGAMSFRPLPAPESLVVSLIDADGALYFASETTAPTVQDSLGVVDPATGAITTFPLSVSTPGAQPVRVGGIAVGADGNIYFTDSANNAIGKFVVNDPSHPITETQLPTIAEGPAGIGAGPNGLIYYGYHLGIGSYDPTTGHFAQAALYDTVQQQYTTPTSFALGGDGRLYFAETYNYHPRGPFDSQSYGLGSLDPSAPVSSSNLTFYADNAMAVATEPGGNIAFTTNWSGSAVALGVGEFDTATHSATVTPLPTRAYAASTADMPIAVGPSGTITFGLTGALGVATEIPANQAVLYGTVNDLTYSTIQPVGRPGQVVYLDLNNDGRLDPGDPTAVTDPTGSYSFAGLAPGTYTVRMVLYPGALLKAPAGGSTTLSVSGGQAAAVGTNFGVVQTSVLAPLASPANLFGPTNPPDFQTAVATAYYQTILGRMPDATWLNAAVAYLKGGGSTTTLAESLLTSPEYETRLVASYYQDFLGRTATVAEINAWVQVIEQQHLTNEQVAIAFLTSDQFNARYPTNTTFIQALYEDLLGRQPQAWELASWLGVLGQGVTRSQAVASLVRSNESLAIALGIAGQIYDGRTEPGTQFVSQVQSGQMSLDEAIAFAAFQPEFVVAANQAVAG